MRRYNTNLYNTIRYDTTNVFHICWLFCFVMQAAADGSPAARAYYLRCCFLGVLVMLRRIAVSGIDDSALGFGETFHKKPGIDGKKIYILVYRNAFIKKLVLILGMHSSNQPLVSVALHCFWKSVVYR